MISVESLMADLAAGATAQAFAASGVAGIPSFSSPYGACRTMILNPD
jgi:hypothetical protein